MRTPTQTAALPAVIRHLIKTMRSASGKRYAPREVLIQFVPGAHVEINLAAFSFNAVAGEEISRKPAETWMGSDGEPNYTELACFRGPVVAHHGHNSRDARVTVYIPTGLSDECSAGNGYRSPHGEACEAYSKLVEAGDLMILTVLSDKALEA